jgi:hypothetical protein
MADPLSTYLGILSSVASLLQLSRNVTDFIRNIRTEDEQKRDLLKEIAAIEILLEDLDRKAKSPAWEKTLRSISMRGGPLDSLKAALQTLNTKLRPVDSSLSALANRLLWYFEKDEYDEILSKIERSKSTLVLALGW